MPAQGVDGLRSLADEQIAGAEHHGGRLLRLALHGHEAHGRPLGGLADRLGIRHVVLLALDERLHVGRRDQPHLVAELADRAAPVMRARAGLHGDDGSAADRRRRSAPARAGASCGTERRRIALAPCAWNTFLARSRPMVLTSSTDASLRWSSTPPPWHVDAVGGRPPHHWNTTTFLAGLRQNGITAPLVLDGPMTGAAFQAYVEQFLAPTLFTGRCRRARQPCRA